MSGNLLMSALVLLLTVLAGAPLTTLARLHDAHAASEHFHPISGTLQLRHAAGPAGNAPPCGEARNPEDSRRMPAAAAAEEGVEMGR